MIQQLKPNLNRQINSYVAKRFLPSGSNLRLNAPAQEYEYRLSKMKITPIDFQTASVVSWVKKGRLTQWGTTLRSKIKTATGASSSHHKLEDYITFAGETS